MATAKQSLVAAGGIGLIVANYWTGPARSTITGGLFGSGDTGAAHSQLGVMVGELLFVIVAAILAGISDAWGTAMVAVIAALFILWSIHHFAGNQGG